MVRVFFTACIIVILSGCTGGSGGGGTSESQANNTPSQTGLSETYTISGTLTGDIVSGVTITLTGPDNATTTTDENGSYSFEGLQEGTYTVTPSKENYNFDPSSFEVELSEESTTQEVDISTQKKALFGEAKWGEAKWN